MKQLLSLFAGIILLFTPVVGAHAAGSVTKAYVTVTAPKVGERPIMRGTVPSSASTMVTRVEWSGNLDENGCFKAGEAYTVKIHLQIKNGMDKIFRNYSSAEWKINGKGATFKIVDSSSNRKCILQYTFGRIGMGSNIIRNADFTITPPVPGQKPATTATVNNPEIEIVDIKWVGEFDEEGNFKNQESYSAVLNVSVKQGCLGTFNMMDENNNFTFNGKKVRPIQKGSKTDMTVHWKGYTETSLNYIDMSRIYTLEQADKYHKTYQPLTINLVKLYMENAEQPGEDRRSINGAIDRIIANLPLGERFRIERVIVNIPDNSSYKFMLHSLPNVKEIWFDTTSEPALILSAFMNDKNNAFAYYSSSKGGTTRDMAIYLPASKYPKGLVSLQEQNRGNLFWMGELKTQILKFRTYTYTGNMYKAMNDKESTCKMYCPGHVFTAKVAAAHTVMRQVSCKQNPLFYYSCKYCGECEHNPDHTFQLNQMQEEKTYPCEHTYVMYDLSEKNYLGRNTKGEKVYVMSCCYCGINEREEIAKMTKAEYLRQYGPNPEVSLEVFKQVRLESMDKGIKKYVLNETFSDDPKPGYFAVVDDDHGYTSWDV